MSLIKALPLKLQKVAETELAEVPHRIPEDLKALRTWIEQQPHLNARLEEQFLIQYLRGCKYSLEKAKTKLDLFFTLKSKFPDLFNVTDINEARFRKINNKGFGLALPQPLNEQGPRIFFLTFEGDIGKGLYDIEDLFRVMNAMHEIFIVDDSYACINGIVYILDLKNISLNMASKFTPSFLRKIVQFYEKSLPLRIKACHMLNTPGFFHSVLSILLPLLSEKLRKRMFVYGQNYTDDLEKNIPKKYLPTYLGGDNGVREQLIKDFDQKWLEYKDYFKQNENYGTEELLRPGKPIDFDSMYGLGGSFRKLDVD
ncbi:alpha-tocopherol transfer protein-like [Lucilia sericata]|uniref:alpha-tocopherol transfer protein-like n=1 Tax=Lucilia sericata TaxID=13632 RepID=UPI0018A82F37|nr:alpha-tocopherol transfer protein-like [Lucilia sericata]